MNLLSVLGLALDLLGVFLLGFDLVRVQSRLRSDAEDRVATLDAILEDIGGIDGWAQTVSSDFRDWHLDEGRAVGIDGTFDARVAGESFREALATIAAVGTNVLMLAKMQLASVEADRATAKLSLRLSYVGLALIFVGFCLQILGYMWPSV
ncbi:MAG: hypothetical protein NW203_10555 [Hyphomonadaceae bacterium]|nr:hypothetical protein [Hyphomonadaceae bacterium]